MAAVTEAEFLITVLTRKQLVDETTIACIRRQFRELVRHRRCDVPVHQRVFDSKMLFELKVRKGQIRQRSKDMDPGSSILCHRSGLSGGLSVLVTECVDLSAPDGGYTEWFEYFWEPYIRRTWQEQLDERHSHRKIREQQQRPPRYLPTRGLRSSGNHDPGRGLGSDRPKHVLDEVELW